MKMQNLERIKNRCIQDQKLIPLWDDFCKVSRDAYAVHLNRGVALATSQKLTSAQQAHYEHSMREFQSAKSSLERALGKKLPKLKVVDVYNICRECHG